MQSSPVPVPVAFCPCGRSGLLQTTCACGQQFVTTNPNIRIGMMLPNAVSQAPPSIPSFPNQVHIDHAYNFNQAAQQAANQYSNRTPNQPQNAGGRGRRRDQSRVQCVSCNYMKRVNQHPQCWHCHIGKVPMPNPNHPQPNQSVTRVSSPVVNGSNGVIEAWEQQLQVAANNMNKELSSTTAPPSPAVSYASQTSAHSAMEVDQEQMPSDRQQSLSVDRQSRRSRSMSRTVRRQEPSPTCSPTRSMQRTPPTSPYPSVRIATTPFADTVSGSRAGNRNDIFTSRSPSPMPFQQPADITNVNSFGIDRAVQENQKKLFDNAKQLWTPGFPSLVHGGFEYEKVKIYVPKNLTPKMKEQSNWICEVAAVQYLDLGQLPTETAENRQALQAYLCNLGNSFSDLEMMAALATYVKSQLGKHIKQVQGHITSLLEREKQMQSQAQASVPPLQSSQPGTPTDNIIDMLKVHCAAASSDTQDIIRNVINLLQDLKTQRVIDAGIPPTQVTQMQQTQPLSVPSTPPQVLRPADPVTVTPSFPTQSSSQAADLKGTPNSNADAQLVEQLSNAIRTEIHSDSSAGLSPVREQDESVNMSTSTQGEVEYIEDLETVYQKVPGGTERNRLVRQNAVAAWGSLVDNHADEAETTPVLTREQWQRTSEIDNEINLETSSPQKSPKSKRARKEKSIQKEKDKQEKVDKKVTGAASSSVTAAKSKQTVRKKR